MADHIERVIVQGDIELNTGNATKQLDSLKKPIKVELDLQSSEAIAKTQKEINALLRKINSMDFDGLKQSLTKSIANGSKDGIKEAERQAKLLSDAFNKTLWKSKNKDGKEISHTFATAMRDIRKELVSMSAYINKLTNSKDNELSLKVKIENINDFTQSMQEAKGRIETFQDVLGQLDNNSVFSLLNEQIKDITSSIQILTNNFKELNTAAEEYANLPDKAPKRKKNKNIMTNDEFIDAEKKARDKAEGFFNSENIIALDIETKHLESGIGKISAKIKDVYGEWKSFSATITKSGDLVHKRFKSIEETRRLEERLNKKRRDETNLSANQQLEEALKIRNALSDRINDSWKIKVESSGIVTITKDMKEADNVASQLTQTFKSTEDAINNFSNVAEKGSTTLKSIKESSQKTPDKTIGQTYEEKRKEKEKRIAAEKKALEKLQKEEDKKAAKTQKQKDSQPSVNYVDMAIARREKEARDFAKRLKNDMSERYDISKTLDKFQKWDDKIKSYNELGSKFEGATAYQKILPVLEKVKNAFSDINSEIAKGDNADFSKIEQQMNEIASSVKKVDTAFEGLQKPVGNLGKIASNDTLSWLEKNTKALKKYGEELKEIATLQAKSTIMGELNSLTGRRNELVSSAKREGLVGKSWTDSFKKGLGSLSQIFGSFSLLNRADDIAHEMIGTIHEVDDALTDLQMATNVSDKEAQSLMETYSQMGKELKATGVDVAKSSTEWLKQGKSLKEAETLTTDSIILSKVGDLSSEESTKYLTSAMKGFKVEAKDALNIVDQLSAVDMASATDVGGLAEAMSKTAVTAQDAGIEMQRLIGYIATVGETTQADMGSVGNAFKTIFTRMSDIKAGKLKLIDEDGTTETLSDVEQTLSNVGIDLRKTVTEYNDYGDVLDNLASKWDNLSQLQQNALAKAFAGTRQAEVFRTLMANYDSAKKYMQTANESEGYATEKFEAYQNSLSGAIEGFKNSFQTLSNTVVGSDFLKGIVNAGTTTLNILDSIIERLGTIPSLLGAFGIFQGIKGGGWSSQKIVCVSL